jgi:hypothetical protein
LYLFYLFFDFISKTRSSYPEIYPEGSDEDEDGGYDLSRESQFVAKMGRLHRNYLAFSRWNITKKEIYKLNCHEFLYWAAYMIDKRKVEVARLEKNNINVLNSYAVTTF